MSLGPTEVVGTPKLAPTGSGVPKTYPLISITPYLPQSLLLPLTPLSPGPLRTSVGLRKPSELLEAFGSLGSSVRLRDLVPLAPPHPSLSLAPLSPLTPSASLGHWNLPGASGSLGSLWKPLAAFGLQSDSGALLPLLPSSLSLPLTPSCSPSPPEPPWVSLDAWDLPGASASLGSLQKPLAALDLQSDSGALLSLLPLNPSLILTPPCPLSLPEPLWASGTFLGPQEALDAFGKLGSSVRLRGLPSLAPLAPLFPLVPSHSPHPLSLPGPS